MQGKYESHGLCFLAYLQFPQNYDKNIPPICKLPKFIWNSIPHTINLTYK